MIVVTNNNLLYDVMLDKQIFSSIEYSDVSFLDILLIAKGKIKNGFILLTHPFLGLQMPNEQLYKTLALSLGGEAIDFNSLKLINYAINKTTKALSVTPQSLWVPEDLEDFKKVDLVTMERWLRKVYYRGEG